jgi:hypothetical protein
MANFVNFNELYSLGAVRQKVSWHILACYSVTIVVYYAMKLTPKYSNICHVYMTYKSG